MLLEEAVQGPCAGCCGKARVLPVMNGILLRRIGLGVWLLPGLACGANPILNPDFTNDLSDWTPSPGAAWNSSMGSPAPGSAQLTAGEGVITTLTQCVALPSADAASVSLSAEIYVYADSTNTAGNGYYITTSAFADAACSDLVSYNGNALNFGPPKTTWTEVSNNYFPLPAGYLSMLVTIRVAGNVYYADYGFDHLMLTLVTDRVFATGFEPYEGYQ
jgi:hypothetical protein